MKDMAYVVACYFGARRVHDPIYEANPMDYIERHLEQLSLLETSHIAEIIFVINGDTSPLKVVPTSINGDTPVRVYSRDNIGMSYGAWNHAMNNSDYPYYFLIEDDYVPVLDNFDDIFVNKMTSNTGGNTAYVCSLYLWGHAAITNGLIAALPVRAVGGVPYAPSNNYGANETVGQVGFSRILETHGFGVEHVADEFSIPFLDAKGGMLYYGNPEGKQIVVPVALERDRV